jgi:hypothetical protein
MNFIGALSPRSAGAWLGLHFGWRAEKGRHGESGEHNRDRRGLAILRHQSGRHHCADAEEGAVGQ